MRPGPATSTPRCCRSGSGCSGPEHPDTLTAAEQPRLLDRGGGGCGRGPRPVRRAAAGHRAGPGPRAPGHPDHPRQPRLLDRGRRGMRPGPATSTPRCCPSRAGAGPRAPGHPGHPRQPRLTGPGRRGMRPRPATSTPRCWPSSERVLGPEHPDTLTTRAQPRLLDRGGGGCGRGPRPVRRAAAHPRAGAGPRAPRHPDHPRQPRLLDRGGGGCRPRPATSTPRCCPSWSGCWAPSTRSRWPSGAPSPTGPGRRGMRAGARDQSAALLPILDAGAGPRAPGHPEHPRRPCPLERRGG